MCCRTPPPQNSITCDCHSHLGLLQADAMLDDAGCTWQRICHYRSSNLQGTRYCTCLLQPLCKHTLSTQTLELQQWRAAV